VMTSSLAAPRFAWRESPRPPRRRCYPGAPLDDGVFLDDIDLDATDGPPPRAHFTKDYMPWRLHRRRRHQTRLDR
jgi:hypothetical protein